jgi:hypothetical protein
LGSAVELDLEPQLGCRLVMVALVAQENLSLVESSKSRFVFVVCHFDQSEPAMEASSLEGAERPD